MGEAVHGNMQSAAHEAWKVATAAGVRMLNPQIDFLLRLLSTAPYAASMVMLTLQARPCLHRRRRRNMPRGSRFRVPQRQTSHRWRALRGCVRGQNAARQGKLTHPLYSRLNLGLAAVAVRPDHPPTAASARREMTQSVPVSSTASAPSAIAASTRK